MAELVQSHIEEMLGEVYELQQLGILSAGEAKSVIKTRTSYEYKVRRRISRKDDYTRFIDYELKLEQLKQSRIKKYGITDISEGSRYKSVQRIHFLFQKSLRKFKTDIKMWVKYIDFCKSMASDRSLGFAFVQAIKYNPTNTMLWIMSAKHELEINKNMSASRTIFLKAIKINPGVEKLWLEYFRMELLHVEKVRKREKLLEGIELTEERAFSREFVNFKTVKIVFRNALISLKLTCLQGFIDVAKKSEGTDSLIQFMFEQALKTGSDLPDVWISLAAYILSRDAPDKCLAILQTSITSLKSSKMLYKVGEFLLEHSEELPNELISTNFSTLTFLDTDSVIKLIKLCLDNNISADLTGLMDRAMSQFTGDKDLWIFKLQNLSTNIRSDYKKSISCVTDNIILWQGYLLYLCMTESVDVCKSEWGVGLKSSVAAKLIPLYLEWLYAKEGIKSVREAYQTISTVYPLGEDIIVKCIKLEEAELSYNNVYKLSEELCVGFGGVTNWSNFITLCKDHFPDKLTSVIWKAKKYLNEDDFVGFT